jgi:hypothetical protein
MSGEGDVMHEKICYLDHDGGEREGERRRKRRR